MAAVIALLALGIAYVTASRAIDTGSLWQYALTLLFLFIAGIEVGKIVRKEQHI